MSTIKKLVLPGSEGLLSPLSKFLTAKDVSEILINKPGEIWVDDSNGMSCHKVPEFSNSYLRRLFNFIANENSQILNADKPFLSGSTFDGSRVQLIIPPASTQYVLSIRRQTLKKLTLDYYVKSSFFDNAQPFSMKGLLKDIMSDEDLELLELYKNKDWNNFLAKAIDFKKNIMISGGTHTGKTTFLNMCASLIPHHERIITLEDTLEVKVPHLNQVNLLAPKGGNITMQALLQTTLRLRPDRIIMGEIRGAEILDFISACSTGHDGSIATLHASNPRAAMMRMVQLYKQNNVPSMRDEEIRSEIESVVDIIMQIKKTDNGREAAHFWFKHAEV